MFLDIDGVLNSVYGIHTQVPGHGVMGIEDLLKERFFRILSETEAKIVLCSTWRRYDHLVEHLNERLAWGDRYIGNTGIWPWWEKKPCPYEDERQWEVEQWIEQHPEIERWVCLDDSIYPVNKPNGIKINSDNRFGVSDEQIDEIIRYFKEGEKHD